MADEPGDFRMAGAYVDVHLRDHTQDDEDAIRARIQGNDAVTIATRLGDPDDKRFREKVSAVARETGDANPVKLGIRLDEKEVTAFEARVHALIASANSKSVSISTSSTGQAGGTGAAGGGGGGLGFAGAVGLASTLGAGAIGGVALAAVPAVFTAIGVAAEHSNPAVTQSLDGMTAAGKKALQEGFQPLIPALVDLGNEGRQALTGMTPEFQVASAAAAPLLKIVGSDFIQATKEGVGESIPILQSVRPIAQAVGDDLIKTEQGIGGFFKNIDVGRAATGLEEVGDDIKAILPALASLVNDVAPVGNAFLGVLGPAAKDMAQDFNILRPIIDATGSTISFLGPLVSSATPPVLALMAASKLLTGSWTDFTGAGSKVKAVFQDANSEFDKGKSTLDSLAQKIGITTQATKDAAIADAKLAVDKATVTLEAKNQALAEAQAANAAENSAKSRVVLREAEIAQAAAAREATVAETALTEAGQASTFSLGPLGVALGVVGGALALVGLNSEKSEPPVENLTDQMVRLAQASPEAAKEIIDSTPAVEQLVNKAKAAGVSVNDLLQAYRSGPDALRAFSNELGKQHEQLGQTQIDFVHTEGRLSQSFRTIGDLTDAVNRHDIELSKLPPRLRDLVNEYNNQNDVQTELGTNIDTLTQRQAANSTVTQSATQQLQLSSAAQQEAGGIALALGVSVDSVTQSFTNFAQKAAFTIPAAEQMADAFITQSLAVAKANSTISSYFQSADSGLSQAQSAASNAAHSYQQSLDAIGTAEHSYAQSRQAVATAEEGVAAAERGVIAANQGVVTAEQNVTKARAAATAAQQAETQAIKQAQQELISLQLQMNDQIGNEEAARTKLFDQEKASADFGVTTQNARQIAAEDVTDANENQVKSAQDLQAAMDTLAETLNTGVNLRDQLNTANQEGVAASPGVVSAQQAVASAQEQVNSAEQALVAAHQAVTDAEANVVKAHQQVTDASYNEQQAAKAVTEAQYNARQQALALAQAETALKTAQDNASSSLDLHTAAGQRNLAMLQQVHDQLLTNEAPAQAYNDLIKDTAQFFGGSTDAAQAYLHQLGLIPQDFHFGMTAVATADLSELNQAYAKITASGRNATPGLPVPHATGGPIVGIGGPTDDANLILASAGEFMQPASSVDYYGASFMEDIRNRKIPKDAIRGFASGGLVGRYGDVWESLQIGAVGADYQAANDALRVLGLPAPPPLPVYVPPAAQGFSSTGANVVGNRAANRQIVMDIFASMFGWGTSAEQSATDYLLMRESGYNNLAQNPTSTAFGMFQFLNSTWGGYGIPKTADPTQQTVAGGRYIAGRYVDPIGAAGHERAYNWFDSGGYLLPGKDILARNGTGQPEMVLPAGMSRTLESINAAVGGSSVATAAPEVHHHHHYHTPVTVYANSSEDAHQVAQRVNADLAWSMRTSR